MPLRRGMFTRAVGLKNQWSRDKTGARGAETIAMTTNVASATLPSSLARPPWRARVRLEHVVMGGAILALVVLVVLPLLSLLLGSVKGEDGLSLDHFSEVLSGRLYLTALKNSLILGAWTGLFSLVIGLALAWAVSRTDVPAKPLIQLTATLSYLSPPFLTACSAPMPGSSTCSCATSPGSPGSPSTSSPCRGWCW
jgi:hypothetical protein